MTNPRKTFVLFVENQRPAQAKEIRFIVLLNVPKQERAEGKIRAVLTESQNNVPFVERTLNGLNLIFIPKTSFVIIAVWLSGSPKITGVQIIPDGLGALVMLAVVDGRPQELRPEGSLRDVARFVGVRLKKFIIKSLSVVSLILLTLIPKET